MQALLCPYRAVHLCHSVSNLVRLTNNIIYKMQTIIFTVPPPHALIIIHALDL